MERVTIKDIAKEAGVSIGTVYRALNNKGRIKKETKQRILSIAAELNYTPNTVARKFALWNKFTLLVVMPKEPDYYWSDINKGLSLIKNELSEFGLEIDTFFVLLGKHDPNTLHLNIINILEEKKYDGLVIAPLHIYKFHEIVNYVNNNDIPLVIFNDGESFKDRLFYYGPNNVTSGRIAAELFAKFLEEKGNVCVLVNTPHLSLYSERIDGFCGHMQENCPNINIIGVHRYNSGQEAKLLMQIHQENPSLSGIYIIDSTGAGKFGQALKDNNIRNITLVGHESSPFSKKMLLEGYITALVCENKVCQGYYPVKLLYEYLVQEKLPEDMPEHKNIFTNINIVMKENAHYLEYNYHGVGYK